MPQDFDSQHQLPVLTSMFGLSWILAGKLAQPLILPLSLIYLICCPLQDLGCHVSEDSQAACTFFTLHPFGSALNSLSSLPPLTELTDGKNRGMLWAECILIIVEPLIKPLI